MCASVGEALNQHETVPLLEGILRVDLRRLQIGNLSAVASGVRLAIDQLLVRLGVVVSCDLVLLRVLVGGVSSNCILVPVLALRLHLRSLQMDGLQNLLELDALLVWRLRILAVVHVVFTFDLETLARGYDAVDLRPLLRSLLLLSLGTVHSERVGRFLLRFEQHLGTFAIGVLVRQLQFRSFLDVVGLKW